MRMPVDEAVKEEKADLSAPAQRQAGTWFAIVFVLTTLAAFFYKSVFLGKSLAKLGLLPHIDALLNPDLKQAIIDIGRDPSGYLIFFPNGHFEDSMWSRFVIPLWNPLIGCGFPLMGDPQAFLHSPAHLLRLFSSPETYSLGLLLEIALGGIGMVLLCRFHSLSLAASIFAALAFVLSPRILVQIDIGGNECFFPFVFLGFSWLAARPSLVRAALVGALCALMAFAAHPETCFFAVLFAAALSFFTMTFKRSGGEKAFGEQLGLILKDGFCALGYLLLSALVSFCVAAPLIFPFAEFMREAHIYKDASVSISRVGLPEFFDGFLANSGAEPFFIGAVAALFVPLGLIGPRSKALPFSLTLIGGMMLCLPDGPILQLLSQKPFSYVATLYGIPDILLLMCLLAAMGFDSVRFRWKGIAAIVLVCSAAVVTYYPVSYLFHLHGAQSLSQLWRSYHHLLGSTSVIAIAALLFYGLALWQNCYLRNFAALALVALNFASLALTDRNILPVNPGFSLQPPEPIAFLQKTDARVLATGGNFLLCNTNMDFALSDFRCFSPLLPLRYLKFLTESGGRCYNLYFYVMPELCSRLLDLASVKYVISRAAVRSEADNPDSGVLLGEALQNRMVPGLRLLKSEFRYDPQNSQINAELTWRIHEHLNYHYALQYCIFSADGKELWSSRELMVSPATEADHRSSVHESWPVPLEAKLPVSLGLRVKDTWISEYIKPDKPEPDCPNAFILCRVNEASASRQSSSHDNNTRFRLVKEFGAEACRIYENTTALPSAYLIQNVHHLKLGDDSLWQILRSPDFDGNRDAIVEDGLSSSTVAGSGDPITADPNTTDPASATPAAIAIKPASLKRPDCNTVEIACDADADSYLILTDTYYKGWKCFVDGRQTEIYPANYLFRAVKVSKGHHKARFVFAPSSYYNSLGLAVLTVLLLAALAFLKRKDLFDCKGAV